MKSLMSKFLAPALVMCLAAALVFGAVPRADAAGQLVAQYKLNGDCKDDSGNGNDGTAVGDVSFADDSTVGKCAVFNGGYINVNSSPALNLGGSFTIAVWVKVDPGFSSQGSIISKLDNDGNYNNYYAYTQGAYGARMDVQVTSGEYNVVNGPFDDFGLSGDWSNLVFSYDGQTLYLYHNGALKGTGEIGSGNSIVSSGNRMRIGTGTDSNFKDLFFKGRMADLRIYDYALSFNEIEALYNGGAAGGTTSQPTAPSGTATPGSSGTSGTNSQAIQSSGENNPGSINILVNGQPLQSDVTPFINADGRTMLPIRAIAEALGADVQWDESTQTATLILGDKTVKVTIGQNSILVNGSPVAMDTVAAVKDGRTVLPVRAVGEALGAQIGWDEQTKTVSIEKSTSTSPAASPVQNDTEPAGTPSVTDSSQLVGTWSRCSEYLGQGLIYKSDGTFHEIKIVDVPTFHQTTFNSVVGNYKIEGNQITLYNCKGVFGQEIKNVKYTLGDGTEVIELLQGFHDENIPVDDSTMLFEIKDANTCLFGANKLEFERIAD